MSKCCKLNACRTPCLFPILSFIMPIISWNYQGAGNNRFCIMFKELVKSHHPMICIILEPRISGTKADSVVNKLGFNKNFREEARGFAGGIWVLWDDSQVTLNILHASHKFVHFELCYKCVSSECTTILYNPHCHSQRSPLERARCATCICPNSLVTYR